MSRPAQQVTAEMQQQQLQRLQSQRVISGIRTGIDLLEDKIVVAPITMHEGLTNLKWLLQGLLAGQFSIDLDPQGQQVPTVRPEIPEGNGEAPDET